MDAAFTGIAFVEPKRAETNLALLQQRLPTPLYAALPTQLSQVPDPDGALNFLERFSVSCSIEVTEYLNRYPAALHYLLLLFSHSRFLSETLIQQPELIQWLHRDRNLGRIKSREDLLEELARFEATSFEDDPSVRLARFKRREYLRITLKDVLGVSTLAECTAELSTLADVLLEKALRIGLQRLQAEYGEPQSLDHEGRRIGSQLAILSLGKLGGEELNYSSDIDLLFLYSHKGTTSGVGPEASRIANSEFFVRLAHAVLKLITEFTSEGPVFRVDLRLRPQGQEGDIAVSVPVAVDYYRTRGREWELQMLIKARWSAGDPATAREFLQQVLPLVYQHEPNLAAVEAVLNAREEISRQQVRRGTSARKKRLPINVKLDRGGIRDIEFLVQCLQRLYGGKDLWLRSGSTLFALQRLHDKGYLTGRDYFRLATAYEFLRDVEHRLQLVLGQQTHSLPADKRELELLARRCSPLGAGGGGQALADHFVYRLRQHLSEVQEIYERILHEETPASAGEVKLREPSASSLAPPESMYAGVFASLREKRPALASAIESLGLGDQGRRRLHRVLAAVVENESALNQMDAHRELVPRLIPLLALSDWATDLAARHPRELCYFLAGCAGSVFVPRALAQEAAEFSLPARLSALRAGYRAALIHFGAASIAGHASLWETLAGISSAADRALTEAWKLVLLERLERDVNPEEKPFACIALGRLGTQEMDIGSDADLVFVAAEDLSVEERDEWRSLAERFIHLLSSHTREGTVLSVDARLRPGGGQGDLVQPASYLRQYFTREAQPWEAATYLKARVVAGNHQLGEAVVREIQDILLERFSDDAGLAASLGQIRERLEQEIASDPKQLNFKTGVGGFYDVDYALAYSELRSRATPGARNTLEQIRVLEGAGALAAEDAGGLRSAATFLRSLDHAVRLATGRAHDTLPERPHWSAVAEMLTRWLGKPISGASLPNHLVEHQRIARQLYQKLVR